MQGMSRLLGGADRQLMCDKFGMLLFVQFVDGPGHRSKIGQFETLALL